MVNLVRTKRSNSVSSAGSRAESFWAPLVDENGKGTRLMWRLADSVFFHMQAQTRVWHGIDASQLFWLLYLDDAGIHHTPVIVNGQKVPTLDRLGWFGLMVWEAQTAPDYAHRWWANLCAALPLQDPQTRRAFPCAPPRACFPDKPVLMSGPHRALQPGLPAHEPDYVFLPRVRADTRDPEEKRKEKEKDKGKLHKMRGVNGNGTAGEKSSLRKDKPAPPPVAFVTNGRMHKAHPRPNDGVPQDVPPRPQTATGHYETPVPVRQWPDTRGLPQLKRNEVPVPLKQRTLPPPTKPRRTIMDRVLPTKAFRRSTPSLVGSPSVRAGDTLVPVGDVPAVQTTFGPEGEGMHAVVQRALETEPKRPVPLMRRHSSEAILSPLVEKTEAESTETHESQVQARPVSG
ncbi:hypothetical protein AURDEDRAFT_171902 [Auricularia subglabra TFB-10046 SS5]|uniref:DUF7514 domain-containing protein n=1 Tax=Auricularia subglabra (strain TFB-10046 / SS5) TaxID=717982 RepID=J0WVQ0_AURST|nr:hypothetical protein AURDEDRAFT_171902 [Auricularia subglabra TFB-10046 SS5]